MLAGARAQQPTAVHCFRWGCYLKSPTPPQSRGPSRRCELVLRERQKFQARQMIQVLNAGDLVAVNVQNLERLAVAKFGDALEARLAQPELVQARIEVDFFHVRNV